MLTMGVKTCIKLKDVGLKEKFVDEQFAKVRTTLSEFLKPETFRDSDIKDTTLEDLKYVTRLLSFFHENVDERSQI